MQPGGDRADVLSGDGAAILMAQQIFQQHFQGVGQAAEVTQAGGGSGEGVDLVGGSVDGEGLFGVEAIHGGGLYQYTIRQRCNLTSYIQPDSRGPVL